jgi:hypothetical protein
MVMDDGLVPTPTPVPMPEMMIHMIMMRCTRDAYDAYDGWIEIAFAN